MIDLIQMLLTEAGRDENEGGFSHPLLRSAADALTAAAERECRLREENARLQNLLSIDSLGYGRELARLNRELAEVRKSVLIEVATFVKSCREGGNMKRVVQVFDVLADHILKDNIALGLPSPEAPQPPQETNCDECDGSGLVPSTWVDDEQPNRMCPVCGGAGVEPVEPQPPGTTRETP